jgi:hypothetical protein
MLQLLQPIFLWRCRLHGVQHAWLRENLIDAFEMCSSAFFIIELCFHVYFLVSTKIKLRELSVVIQRLTTMLKFVVGEKASVNMIGEIFSQFKNELMLQHLDLQFSVIQVNHSYHRKLAYTIYYGIDCLFWLLWQVGQLVQGQC